MIRLIFILSAFFFFFQNNAQAQYAIGETTITFSDASRSGGIFGGSRNIETKIYYPAATAGTNTAIDPSSFPVLVFGHGFSMNSGNFANIKNNLVPEGYIVMMPDTETGVLGVSHNDFALDFVFILDEMQNNTPAFFVGHLTNRSAVMGHSMGGGASMLATKNANAEFTTSVTFGAVETDPAAIVSSIIDTNDNLPSLTIGGELDCVATSGMSAGGPDQIYPALDSDYKAFAEIAGASHCQFGQGGSNCGLGELGCSVTISESEQHTRMFKLATPWLDFFLKDKCSGWIEFQDYMTNNNGELSATAESGTPPTLPTAMLPTIMNSGGILTSSVATAYQWYLDGALLSGEINQSITVTSNGNYEVEITNEDGCIARTGLSINLPISLISFEAEKNNRVVDLTWITETETNNAFFELEHSADGFRYEPIYKVDGAGFSDQRIYYDFSHQFPVNGYNYYRLKQVDFDGRLSYSKVIEIRFNSKGIYQLMPNVQSQGQSIHLAVDPFDLNKEIQIAIYNNQGQLLSNQQMTIDANQLLIPSMHLPKGLLFVHISLAGHQEVFKLTIF